LLYVLASGDGGGDGSTHGGERGGSNTTWPTGVNIVLLPLIFFCWICGGRYYSFNSFYICNSIKTSKTFIQEQAWVSSHVNKLLEEVSLVFTLCKQVARNLSSDWLLFSSSSNQTQE
jgi:hypothetical protein